MGPSFRSRGTRTTVVALLLALVATSCIWPGPRGDSRSLGFQSVIDIHPADVRSLVTDWSATIDPASTTPVVGGDVAVVGGGTTLRAFTADGCGAPTCAPRWRANAQAPGFGQPVIANGIVYVVANQVLQAYDLHGVTKCGGTPVICTPLWTGTTFADEVSAGDGVVVATGTFTQFESAFVYAAGDGTGCSGTPKTCQPIRRLDYACGGVVFCDFRPPSIGDGMIAIGLSDGDEFDQNGALFVFDLAGVHGCSPPSPPALQICNPTARSPVGGVGGAPAIHDGVVTVVVMSYFFDDFSFEYLFKLHGLRTYDPATDTITMSWQTESLGVGELAMFGGVIYETDGTTLRAHRASDGAVLWSATLSGSGRRVTGGGGVVYVTTDTGVVNTFDAAGIQGCAGVPKVCTSLGDLDAIGSTGVALSTNRLWLARPDGTLRVMKAPRS